MALTANRKDCGHDILYVSGGTELAKNSSALCGDCKTRVNYSITQSGTLTLGTNKYNMLGVSDADKGGSLKMHMFKRS